MLVKLFEDDSTELILLLLLLLLLFALLAGMLEKLLLRLFDDKFRFEGCGPIVKLPFKLC